MRGAAIERTPQRLRVDLTPANWAGRTISLFGFAIIQLGISLVLLVHCMRNHWRCDDPMVVVVLFALTVLCALWAVLEQRRREWLTLDAQSMTFERGWGPFAQRVEAPLDEARLAENVAGVVLACRGRLVRVGRTLPAASSAVVRDAIQDHLMTHLVRLR
jgi:hypothetical protein